MNAYTTAVALGYIDPETAGITQDMAEKLTGMVIPKGMIAVELPIVSGANAEGLRYIPQNVKLMDTYVCPISELIKSVRVTGTVAGIAGLVVGGGAVWLLKRRRKGS